MKAEFYNDKNSNKSKPMLSSRLLKFRACLKNSSEIHEVMSFCKEYVKIYTDITEKGYTKLSIDNFEPLMQFTGMKDRNNVEIYEGDKIKYKNFKGYSKIVFEKGAFGYYGISCFITLLETNTEYIEVIGNVFQYSE